MTIGERPPTTMDLYESLIRLPPKPRMIAGALCIAFGVGVTVLLWNRGWVWGLSLFAAAGGVVLFFSGIYGMGRLKDRKAAWDAFLKRKEALLDSMVEEKRQGRNPVRWLNDQGLRDPEMRSVLIEELGARMKAQGLPEDPDKKRRA